MYEKQRFIISLIEIYKTTINVDLDYSDLSRQISDLKCDFEIKKINRSFLDVGFSAVSYCDLSNNIYVYIRISTVQFMKQLSALKKQIITKNFEFNHVACILQFYKKNRHICFPRHIDTFSICLGSEGMSIFGHAILRGDIQSALLTIKSVVNYA